jgi:beta-glucosidase
MPVHIEGFSGGDRTSIDLPAAQEKMLEAVASTGKPVIVVSLSGSALALTWAKAHAAAVLQAWYPGVEGGTAIAQTLAGLNNPGGRLPITFYASTSELPAFTDYSMKNRTYKYFTGQTLWGFGYGLSYTSFKYGPVSLSSASIAAGQPLNATVTVTNTSSIAGDETVEAYLKTPQSDGPVHSLVGFQRVHLGAGESKTVPLKIRARALSSVDAQGQRAVLPGSYLLSVGGAQPQETAAKSEVRFTVTGMEKLPK